VIERKKKRRREKAGGVVRSYFLFFSFDGTLARFDDPARYCTAGITAEGA
jgi:hypothetical protein